MRVKQREFWEDIRSLRSVDVVNDHPESSPINYLNTNVWSLNHVLVLGCSFNSFRRETVLSTITGTITRLSCLAWMLPWICMTLVQIYPFLSCAWKIIDIMYINEFYILPRSSPLESLFLNEILAMHECCYIFQKEHKPKYACEKLSAITVTATMDKFSWSLSVWGINKICLVSIYPTGRTAKTSRCRIPLTTWSCSG